MRKQYRRPVATSKEAPEQSQHARGADSIWIARTHARVDLAVGIEEGVALVRRR